MLYARIFVPVLVLLIVAGLGIALKRRIRRRAQVVDVLGSPDEPEVSLHPGAQEKLMDFLFDQVKAKKHQVVMTPHRRFRAPLPGRNNFTFSVLIATLRWGERWATFCAGSAVDQ